MTHGIFWGGPKEVSHWFPDTGTKSFTLSPKNGFLAQTVKLGQNWHFWLNIGILGPFGPMPDQKKCEQGA